MPSPSRHGNKDITISYESDFLFLLENYFFPISTHLQHGLYWGRHCEDTEKTWALKIVEEIEIYCL